MPLRRFLPMAASRTIRTTAQMNVPDNRARRFSTVDDFVLRKPPTSINRNSFQQAARNKFNINQLETTDFNKLQ
jgi:hypothetical protein